MKIVKWSAEEMALIEKHGELCIAATRAAMERNKINFDQVEQINDHYENHRWGSNTDRKYRKAAINKAIMKVAGNPLKYAIVG